ncbi:MAG TPA: (2E,6E)-farnesyl diphosphate synthase [Thioploca sp.]|nr:MAG: (2E,6E)-farnesyl diphosphate synthase [Beggiatoa sp. 4572_84]RKZ63128.1 MAG: (2E,6E)-farnesyl diphosphate synthase [Gammaproteobacteria bacterium]HDN25753.1 (2E,6E)-farnesyl diphosphate synthase [Thioploca sp.]
MSLKYLMTTYRQRVDAALESWLPAASIQPTHLHEAMRYAVLNGGKRVRPLLVYLTGSALDVNPVSLDAPACAVEFVHAYSLVHDDLPAMDDDDLRRGKPTCHKAFDEATAILAGDALQMLAFYILSHDPNLQTTDKQRLEMIETLAQASGSRGMAGGQAIDIESVGQSLNIAELENMHIHKTGALIRASVKLGALASPSINLSRLEKLDHYAKCIGLAFQIQDDILDVESTTKMLGKRQGSDIAHDKVTYPSLLGLRGAKQMAEELIEDAITSLTDFDQKAEPLRWMANYIVTRNY